MRLHLSREKVGAVQENSINPPLIGIEKAEKLIGSKVREQLIRVQLDTGCPS